MADKDKPDVTAPSESIPISTQPNRPPENPVLFRGSGTRKEPDVVRVSGEGVFGNKVPLIPSKASGISRAPPPPPSMSGASSGYRIGDDPLREAITKVVDAMEPPKIADQAPPSTPASLEGGSLPTTWQEAVPYVVWVVLVLGFGLELVAAFVHGEWVHFGVAAVGLVALMTAALHWKQAILWARALSPNWVVGALAALLLTLVLSRFVEEKRWPFLNQIGTAAIPKQATPSTPIALSKPLGGQKIVTATELIEKVDSLQSQLDATNLELKAARQPLGSLGSLGNTTAPTLPATPLCLSGNCPPTPSLGGNIFAIPSADKVAELEAAVQKLEDENRRLEKERQEALAPKPSPPPAQSGPIVWSTDGQLFVVGGDAVHSVHGALFRGTSTTLVTIKEAYAISGLTGRRQELKANVTNRGYYDVDKVDIPPQAAVQLDLVWNPPIPLKDFVDQWGKFHITVVYNGITYEREFDENYVRQKIREQSPDAFGPRVTPRDDK